MTKVPAPTLLLGMLLAGCPSGSAPAGGKATPAAGDAAAGSPDRTVAIVDGAAITEGELMVEAKGALAAAESKYVEEVRNLKSQVLEAMIEDRLLLAKAKSEGISTEDLLAREADAKVTEPTEEYLQEVHRLTKESGRTVPPFPDVKEEIRAYVKSQMAADLRKEYRAKVRAQANVQSFLPPPILARVEIQPDGPSRGDAGAPITIVEFSDYECQYCAGAEAWVGRLLSEYPGKVRVVFQSFPLSIHKDAVKASEAALCAGHQGKYWEMHGTLFANQKSLSVDALKQHARGIALDGAAFDRCLDSGQMSSQVDASRALGEKAGVSSTPTFFVNGMTTTQPPTYEKLKELVDYELANQRR